MSAVMGVLTARIGHGSIPVLILIGFTVLTAFVGIYPFMKPHAVSEAHGRETDMKQEPVASVFSFLRKFPKFAVLLIGLTLAYTSHMLLNTFLYQVVASKGGSSEKMGNIMSICATVEIPVLLCFDLLLKKAECDVWLRFSVIFMAIKAVGTLLAPGIPALYGISVLQMAAWGLIAVSPVYYVNHVVGAEERIKGQAFTAMTYTIGCVLSSFVGGWVLDYGGVKLLLFCAVISGISGAIIMFLFSDRISKTQTV